ncbi:MAG: hypothetical protein KDD35_08660, partial [Bdellovibrionales bacterium]|nr:hypothetical protein [Bdellovibrionales bacterium]
KLEVIFKDQLNKVVLDYEYELELSDTPDTNDGYADARLTFNSKATLNWKEIEINGPYNPNFFRENLPDTKEFFEVQFNPHANIFNQKVYNRDGETRYFLNWQERFTFSEQDRESHIIEACEKGNSPIVWLFDDDIRKLNNQ